MYTIKEASARTGVGAPLIRAWERRYGVVTPTRTASGYRMYDDATLQVLAAMRSLVESGWTASEAARAITAGEVAIDDLAPATAVPRQAPATDAADNRRGIIEQFVAAAEASSAADTEAALDQIMTSGSYEAIVDDLLLPATAALGDSWMRGRLSIAAEHAASAAVGRRLAASFQAAGVPLKPAAVVGLPPGARHELGALAFAVALRRRGTGVLYLGPDVTVDGWIAAMRQTRARAAVLAVPTASDRESATAVIRALRDERIALVAVGGGAAATMGGDGVLVLPQRVVEAAALVARAVARRG